MVRKSTKRTSTSRSSRISLPTICSMRSIPSSRVRSHMNDLRGIIARFKGKRIVVFGDLVADVFVYGEISRVSREAPVLILNRRETQVVPGGAANAIHNIWALG